MLINRTEIIGYAKSIRRDVDRAWHAGIFHLGVSNFLVRGTSLAQRIVLARLLGAENIGHIAVVTATLSLIRLPAGAGTFTVVNKLIAENTDDPKAQKEVLGTSIWINLLTTALMAIFAWLILSNTTWINDLVANRMLRIIVFLLPFIILSEVFKNALMGQRRMRVVAGVDIFLSMVAIIVVIPMAYFLSIQGWFLNRIMVIVLGFGLLTWFLKPILGLKWNKDISRKVITIGGFSFLGQLLGSLQLQFDTLSVSSILGDPALTGIYNTAALMAAQMLFIPGAILAAVFPMVAQNKNNLQVLKSRYWELFRKIGALAAVTAVVMWVASPWIFSIFGPDFLLAVDPFRILMLGFIARSLYVLNNTYLDALGRTDITFYTGAAAAAILILLNITFIPIWGVMGAAWATTISMIISLAIRQAAVHYFIFIKYAVK